MYITGYTCKTRGFLTSYRLNVSSIMRSAREFGIFFASRTGISLGQRAHIPFSRTWHINPPSNCKEDFIISRPTEHLKTSHSLSRPRVSTCSVSLSSPHSIALCMIASVLQKNDTNSTCISFDAVSHADSQAEKFMTEILEGMFVMGTSHLSAELLLSQRKALVIASWHHRLIIHRSFFCRSFQDKRYHYSRFASLAAARSILRCYQEIPDASTTDI
jgi:hypothetical protein